MPLIGSSGVQEEAGCPCSVPFKQEEEHRAVSPSQFGLGIPPHPAPVRRSWRETNTRANWTAVILSVLKRSDFRLIAEFRCTVANGDGLDDDIRGLGVPVSRMAPSCACAFLRYFLLTTTYTKQSDCNAKPAQISTGACGQDQREGYSDC
eukprot:283596-Rhodomonas_salina.1